MDRSADVEERTGGQNLHLQGSEYVPHVRRSFRACNPQEINTPPEILPHRHFSPTKTTTFRKKCGELAPQLLMWARNQNSETPQPSRPPPTPHQRRDQIKLLARELVALEVHLNRGMGIEEIHVDGNQLQRKPQTAGDASQRPRGLLDGRGADAGLGFLIDDAEPQPGGGEEGVDANLGGRRRNRVRDDT